MSGRGYIFIKRHGMAFSYGYLFGIFDPVSYGYLSLIKWSSGRTFYKRIGCSIL